MVCIFPPAGTHDEARFHALKPADREYLWYCLEFCSEVLEKRPVHLEALELAANYLTELGYYFDGLRLDERLVALCPRDPGVRYNLSCSLALVGRVEDAFHELTRAVQDGYRDFRHMSADRDLDALRGDPRFSELLSLAAKSY